MPVRNEWMNRGLLRAAEQVGRNPAERLAWLLDLIQMDREDLARRDPHELLDEIVYFALNGGKIKGGPPQRADIGTLEREFLNDVDDGLDRLRNGQPWIVREPKLNFHTSLEHGRAVEGSAQTLFVWQAWNLINEHRTALHRCERSGCDRWFVAVRPFQKYCRSQCGQIIHNRTFQTKLKLAQSDQTKNKRVAAANR
jgi:hypothetical protein